MKKFIIFAACLIVASTIQASYKDFYREVKEKVTANYSNPLNLKPNGHPSLYIELEADNKVLLPFKNQIKVQANLNGYRVVDSAKDARYTLSLNVIQTGSLPASIKIKALKSYFGTEVNGSPQGKLERDALGYVADNNLITIKNNTAVGAGMAGVLANAIATYESVLEAETPTHYLMVTDISFTDNQKTSKRKTARLFSEVQDYHAIYEKEKLTLLGDDLVKRIAAIM